MKVLIFVYGLFDTMNQAHVLVGSTIDTAAILGYL